MMIVYRVADGKAWTTTTHGDLATSTVHFNPGTTASMAHAGDDITWKESVKDGASDIEFAPGRVDARGTSTAAETGP